MTGTAIALDGASIEGILFRAIKENPALISKLAKADPDSVMNGLKIVREGNPELYNQVAPPMMDPQTNLLNKFYLDEHIEKEIARSQRHHSPLSVAVFDIDGFKGINDTEGHAFGDRVIKTMANILKIGIRETDYVATAGSIASVAVAAKYISGDETFVLLPHTDEKGAYEFAQRIRSKVSEENLLTLAGKKINFTVSGGVAEYLAGDDKDSLVGKADIALFVAKRMQKSNIVNFSQLIVPLQTQIYYAQFMPKGYEITETTETKTAKGG